MGQILAEFNKIQAVKEALEAGLTDAERKIAEIMERAVHAERDLAIMAEGATAAAINLEKVEARRNDLEKDLLAARVELSKEQSSHVLTRESLKGAESLRLQTH